jgi:predicted dehydrogenase
VLAEADRRGVVAYDIMTERFEIATILQRALVNDPRIFGEIVRGSEAEPGVYMESVHHLMKVVAGAPNIRPAWFFDTAEQGEGLNDIGTHLVDLVQWTLFADSPIDYRSDITVLSAQRWPTAIPEADFRRVTNAQGFGREVAASVRDGTLEYFANTLVSYAVKGVHTTLNVIWDWEAPAGAGDTHYAVYRGSRSRIDVRQTKADRYLPELYVVPASPDVKGEVLEALNVRIRTLQKDHPGIGVEDRGGELHVTVPDRRTLPAWEHPNMLAKYYVTTLGTELSRRQPPRVAERRAPK